MLPGNSSLEFQECQLQADANCTLAPTVAARGRAEGVGSLLVSGAGPAAAARRALPGCQAGRLANVRAVLLRMRAEAAPSAPSPAGFPVRSSPPPALPGLLVTPALGLEGGDFACEGSVLPGACAFRDILSAAFTCASLLVDKCLSVAVYTNGTEGCGGAPLAVLKVWASGGGVAPRRAEAKRARARGCGPVVPLRAGCRAGAALAPTRSARRRQGRCGPPSVGPHQTRARRPPSQWPPTPSGRPSCTRMSGASRRAGSALSWGCCGAHPPSTGCSKRAAPWHNTTAADLAAGRRMAA